MKKEEVIDADKLAKQAYKISIGNIFITIYSFITGTPMFFIFSLAICALVFKKANKAKNLGSILSKKIKIAKIISGTILVIHLLTLILTIISK